MNNFLKFLVAAFTLLPSAFAEPIVELRPAEDFADLDAVRGFLGLIDQSEDSLQNSMQMLAKVAFDNMHVGYPENMNQIEFMVMYVYIRTYSAESHIRLGVSKHWVS